MLIDPKKLAELLAERSELLALLREMEWSADLYADAGNEICPACRGARPGSDAADEVSEFPLIGGAPRPVGHAPDCRLAAFLR